MVGDTRSVTGAACVASRCIVMTKIGTCLVVTGSDKTTTTVECIRADKLAYLVVSLNFSDFVSNRYKKEITKTSRY